MAKPKRSKKQPNLEFVVDNEYVTMTYARWQKETKKWHEEVYVFHVDYLEEFKDLKQPRSLSKFGSTGYLTCANMLEFQFEVNDRGYKVIKTKSLNEICSYIAIRNDDYLVVPKGDFNCCAIDKYSTVVNNLEDALEILESL